jgi:hypothetical protein
VAKVETSARTRPQRRERTLDEVALRAASIEKSPPSPRLDLRLGGWNTAVLGKVGVTWHLVGSIAWKKPLSSTGALV